MSHAPLSPSARHRWGACPGSVAASAGIAPSESGPAAIDGTHTHFLLEQCLKQGQNASGFVGHTLTDHEGTFIVDAARADRVQLALDYIAERIQVMGEGTRVYSEIRVSLARMLGSDVCDGTIDVLLIGPTSIEVIDLKDGMAEVDVVENPQLMQYAMGALIQFMGDRPPIHHIRMTIVQPKLAIKGGSPISSYDTNDDNLFADFQRLQLQVQAALAPDAPRIAGEKQCRYCPAAGTCTAKFETALAGAGVAFSAIDMPQEIASNEATSMTVERIAQVLEAAPLIRQMLDDVEKEALVRFNRGQFIPGFKVVEGRGSRKWNGDDMDIAAKLNKMGVPKDLLFKSTFVTPAAAEKLTWQKKKRGSDEIIECKLTAKQLETINKEYVSTMAGKPTVVPESDKRRSSIIDISALFGAVEQTQPQTTVEQALALPDWMK